MKIITRDAHILVNNARADGARGPEASTTDGNIRLKRMMLLPATRCEYRNTPVFIACGLVKRIPSFDHFPMSSGDIGLEPEMF